MEEAYHNYTAAKAPHYRVTPRAYNIMPNSTYPVEYTVPPPDARYYPPYPLREQQPVYIPVPVPVPQQQPTYHVYSQLPVQSPAADYYVLPRHGVAGPQPTFQEPAYHPPSPAGLSPAADYYSTTRHRLVGGPRPIGYYDDSSIPRGPSRPINTDYAAPLSNYYGRSLPGTRANVDYRY